MADETILYISNFTSYTDQDPQDTVYYDTCPWKSVYFGENPQGEYWDDIDL